jgi:two-component system, OmpR family, response regulator
MKYRILLIDDDIESIEQIKNIFRSPNFEVVVKMNFLFAFNLIKNEFFDICILCPSIKKKNSFIIAKQIKTVNHALPLFFIGKNKTKNHILKCYSLGADDFFSKPLDADIFKIKVDNIIKKTYRLEPDVFEYRFGDFYFNTNLRSLQFCDKTLIPLTPKENLLLKFLVMNQNEFVAKSTALKLVWKKDDYFASKCLDVYVSRLRKHLQLDTNIKIDNIRLSGFRLIVKNN